MKRIHVVFVLLALVSGALVGGAKAQQPQTANNTSNSAMEQKLRDLEDRVIMLEGELRQLKAQQQKPAESTAAGPITPPSAPGTQPQEATEQGGAGSLPSGGETVRLGGAGGGAGTALNPDISVIGDFIGGAGHNPFNPTPSFQMHESEIGLQAIVDPYARADFFISFGETGVNLEEGFITFTALPKGFVAKAGKMRAAFGKVNTLHNHVLPWVDRPLVSQNLVGGEDGINDAGFSVQHIIPAPRNWFLEATGQTFRGDSADVFTSSKKNNLSVVGHLRGYKDLTDSTNLDLGVSYSRGHNQFGTDFLTNLYGVDAIYRWKPLSRAIYKSFVARTELVWRKQDQPSLVQCLAIGCPVNTSFGNQRAFGFYASADYQFARRWFVGGRVDNSDRAINSRLNDKGGSMVLTYWPSEFAQIRGQYRFTRLAEHFDANEVFLQLQFALGAHGAHPF